MREENLNPESWAYATFNDLLYRRDESLQEYLVDLTDKWEKRDMDNPRKLQKVLDKVWDMLGEEIQHISTYRRELEKIENAI